MAIEYADLSSVEVLVEEIRQSELGSSGLARGTLYGVRRGERTLSQAQLWVIANVCGLPLEFFTLDTEDFEAWLALPPKRDAP